MGEPITGLWNRAYTAPFSGASKWGTGINPIHQFYGESGDPLRVYGREDAIGNTDSGGYGVPRDLATTPPYTASPDFIEIGNPWGYQVEDIAGLDVFQLSDFDANRHGMDVDNNQTGTDDYPNLGQSTTVTRATVSSFYRPPWGISGRFATGMLRRGEHDDDYKVSNQIPTETVNEGWINKPASGMDIGECADDVITSDPSQYEVQTSMTQRNKTLNNDRAVLRGTDEVRTSIGSRYAPMKLKIYSGQQRHYDMKPRRMDDLPRPFWFRRAGTGRPWELAPNEMYVTEVMQRTPPPDPTLGPPEQELSDPNFDANYGYTSEDQGWY